VTANELPVIDIDPGLARHQRTVYALNALHLNRNICCLPKDIDKMMIGAVDIDDVDR
jgi:hypothetical protein